jgi:hypothetical protein
VPAPLVAVLRRGPAVLRAGAAEAAEAEPSVSGKRKKPTRSDLIALLSWAAGQAGGARGDYLNDRAPDRAEVVCRRLTELERRLHEAAAHFPPPGPSAWTDGLPAKAKCAACRHVAHEGRCTRYYSAGPSGTFRCPCEGVA